jgi:4-hydroxy-3-polyprenylbenzoate decarboxylase
MAYSGLKEFISALEKKNELIRIKPFCDPVLEITEITDRMTKSGSKALLFENTGTAFPVLINAFGSDTRMAMAIGRNNLEEAGAEIERIFKTATTGGDSLRNKLAALPDLLKIASILPKKRKKKGTCQQVVHTTPDLGMLPVLKCWPYDGGAFITLPMVHTIHPETGSPNVGMYRMQILDRNTTGMHWQRHKTGAGHYEAWKKSGRIMPVTVTLGGDPVYTYSATAPLPENINEYLLAGFLRKKKVELVRCLTNELYVPCDADIVIEGYVDPQEDLFWEGPFGDHTGFYSLADWYPRFHVTCITHSLKAVYPATIVGIPPQEDAWLAKATEKIFLAPIKMAMQPEIEDFHMPDAGIAHNLAIVKIRKTYPGQGMKVLSSLFGAGQMMFTKYLIVVSGEVNIRDYQQVANHLFKNADLSRDILFSRGPLDVLDHSSDAFSFGGKAGIDATVKHPEETLTGRTREDDIVNIAEKNIEKLTVSGTVIRINTDQFKFGVPLVIFSVNSYSDPYAVDKSKELFRAVSEDFKGCLIVAVDEAVDIRDYHTVAWQVLGNTDPRRDHEYLSENTLFLDGTIKAGRGGNFPRRWPNVVCSSPETIEAVDRKWDSLGTGHFIGSSSEKYMKLMRPGTDEVLIKDI